MIPRRIVKQNTSFFQETRFKTFSEKTILRILSECAATVRKSLQGLGYFAGDDCRARIGA